MYATRSKRQPAFAAIAAASMTKMDIRVWGPRAWTFLHAVAFAYPERPTADDRRAYHLFFRQVARVLPCAVCARHFGAHVDAVAPDGAAFASREALARWLYGVHDEVNAQTGKPRPTFEQVRREYAPPHADRGSWAQLRSSDRLPVVALLVLGAFAASAAVVRARCHARAALSPPGR